jgi:hypothetical protein
MLMRRASKGDIPLGEAIESLKKEIENDASGRLNAVELVQAAKDIFIFTLGVGLERYGDNLVKEQEILGRLADIAIWAFAMESAWLRAEKAVQRVGEKAAHRKVKLATAFIYNTIEKLGQSATQVLFAVAEQKELGRLREDLSRLLKYAPINGIALNREIAADISEAGKYIV